MSDRMIVTIRIISTLIISLGLLLISTSSVSAQVVIIGSFYSQGTDSTEVKDWVEIKNTGDSEVEITGFSIEDTATNNPVIYDWDAKTIIPALGSCVVDVSDRLNQAGDTTYLKNSSGNQIDCVKYGSGNGGVCDNSRNSSEAAPKPISNCFSPTPSPTPSPTAEPATSAPTAAPTATPTKTSTPVPTKTFTPKPTKSPTPEPEVLGEEATSQPETPSPTPLVEASTKKKFPFLPVIFIGSGVLMIGFAVYNLVRARKNPVQN